MTVTISRFIFHKLRQNPSGGFAVTFLQEATLSSDARQFFERLFAAHMSAIRYVFDQAPTAPTPQTKADVQNLLRPSADLLSISKAMTQGFADLHRPQATDGVFIVAVGRLGGRHTVILTKYDHIEAVELLTRGTTANARYTKDALTLDERNVKKFALVDPSGPEGWEVLAEDRQSPPIAEYFRRFLGVRDLRTPAEQTKAALTVTRKWATRASLPTDVFPVDVQYRAVDFLRQNAQFQLTTFLDRVLGTDSPRNRDARRSLTDELAASDLRSNFPVDMAEVRAALQRQVVTTAENVQIVMPRGREAGNVKIDTRGGRYRITIDTEAINTRS